MDHFLKFQIAVDEELKLSDASDSFYAYVGNDKITSLDQLVPPQDMTQLKNSLFALSEGRKGMCCFRIRTAGDVLIWIAANIKKNGENKGIIELDLVDIQSMNEKSTPIQYDAMTELLNKQAITDYAASLTRIYPRKMFYFILLDIDHFKNVNDLFGHMCGDEVIIDVAHIIRDCVGNKGQTGRIGGDEFMVVLDNVDSSFKIREVLAAIRETVEDKYKNFRDEIDVTVSIGAVLYPDDGTSYDELFMLADKMLYRAKMKGRNRYIIYTPEIHGELKEASITNVTTRQVASEDAKIALINGYMNSFLRKAIVPIQTGLENVMRTFELDGVYVFYDNLHESRYGLKRKTKPDGRELIAEETVDMSILSSDDVAKKFDSNNVAILNIFDLKKGSDDAIIKYLEEKEYRFMMIYNMKEAKKAGYVVYTADKESACRLSETDMADLIYFSRMLELTSLER